MSVRRLTVQAERGSDCVTIDVALPAATPVCALLPTIVAMADLEPPPEGVADDWRLNRLSGSTIDDSMTLAENGIHDGELLFLLPGGAPPLQLVQWDPCRTVVATDPPKAVHHGVGPAVACAWAVIAASIALVWAGSVDQDVSYLIAAAAGTCTVAVAALAIGGTAVRAGAVSLGAAAGYLAVPSTPCAASAFLAATAGCAMSLLMLRFAGRPCPRATTVTLVAAATLFALVGLATATPVIATVSTSAVGATLAAASIGLLSVAPRLSILASGLRPDDHADDDVRAKLGHAILTGLVIGCSGGATVGVLVVAVGCRQGDVPSLGSATFTAVVGVVLLLRARSYVDPPRRTALASGGLAVLTVAFGIVAATAPAYAAWSSAAVIALGLCAVSRREGGLRAVRAVELLEYAVLAAVLPLAFWVGDVYTLARESHLL